MPNPVYFALAVIILIVCLVLAIIFAAINLPIMLFLSVIGLLTGIILLIHWSTISFEWQCKECKTVIQLTMWENVKGMNVGVNKKYLYCPTCRNKGTFLGIKKDHKHRV